MQCTVPYYSYGALLSAWIKNANDCVQETETEAMVAEVGATAAGAVVAATEVRLS